MPASTAPPAARNTPAAGHTYPKRVVLAGNPNSGKTTLFNALTGLRAKVGNYPGVTVERKEGRLSGTPKDQPAIVLDLPGTYSLSPQSLDEEISRDVLLERLPSVPSPDVVVLVVDASNLQRNLYFATQIIELGYPTLIALNMIDVASTNGHAIDAGQLSKELGVPVLPIVASTGQGVQALREQILATTGSVTSSSTQPCFCKPRGAFSAEVDKLGELLRDSHPNRRSATRAEAILLLSDEKFLTSSGSHYPEPIRRALATARSRLEDQQIDWRSISIEARYDCIAWIQNAVTSETAVEKTNFSDRLDGIVTHRVFGPLLFLAIMGLMFQSIFKFAEWPMNWLEFGVAWIGGQVGSWISPGPLNDLLVNGIVKGVGAVLVFLPQICFLFLFIGLLEDSGYMARAAFIMDRLMSRVGLHGKSFIPMLSSFACAIPGIMATRTIESPKDRLVTILVAPLMSCAARLPVYTLLIGACIPDQRLLGFFNLQGLTMLSMYLLGIVVALFMAWLFKKTLLKGPTPMLIMELPPYKRPLIRIVLRHMWERSKLFLRRAGTVILGINILLWFLISYPKNDQLEAEQAAQRQTILQAPVTPNSLDNPQEVQAQRLALLNELDKEAAGTRLRNSFAGRLGRLLEPVIQPLGFDWKIGIGIVGSFLAREVFVSTMSLVYNVGEAEESEESIQTLTQTLRDQKRPDGTPVYSTLLAVSLMVFYVFALQCVSTIAIVRRETNGWKWPVFQWVYMAALAWTLAFLTYQGGRLLGFG